LDQSGRKTTAIGDPDYETVGSGLSNTNQIHLTIIRVIKT